MLKDYHIKHVNCLEHILGNIVLNEYSNEGLMYIDSWKFKYMNEKHNLRDKFSVYLDDFSDIYNTFFKFYGVKQSGSFDICCFNHKNDLITVLNNNRFVGLKINSCECPWLDFLNEIHGEHIVLVMDFDDEGIYCSDNSAKKYFLTYDFLFEHGIQFVIYSVDYTKHNNCQLKQKIISDLKNKVDLQLEYNDIKSFANEFIDYLSVDKELKVCDLHTSPLTHRISLVGYSRSNYLKAIEYVYNNEISDLSEFDVIKASIVKITQKWTSLNKKITKYALLNEVDQLEDVKKTLLEIADEENLAAINLLEVLVK